MAEGYSNKSNSSPTEDRQIRPNSANQPSNSSYTMRRGSRNRNGSHSDNNGRPLCRFFRRGACQYGERCRFAHTEPPGDHQPTETASTSSTGSVSPAKLDECSSSSPPSLENWVDAPEFVPSANKSKAKSYADVVSPPDSQAEDAAEDLTLCPYAELHGVCSYPEGECLYAHGDICEYCGNAALHPNNETKRNEHTASCVKQHERNMELSFAVARSKDKSCGVCFEVVMEKSSREQRFGILPNCNHVFCLGCIRKWRQAKQFDNKIIRACPECRVSSDFVCPSMFWVDTKEEKEKLIKDYKVALALKNCKYFKQGRGKCPFGNKCFYLHALPDGTKTDVGPPPRQPRRQNHDGDIDMLQVGECTRELRTELIASMIRFFNGYPTQSTYFNFGEQLVKVEMTEIDETCTVVLDDVDFTIETLHAESGIDQNNGFLFSFVRHIEISSFEMPDCYNFQRCHVSDDDSVSTTDCLSISDDGDNSSMFDVNYDSDGMGEGIWELAEPVDEQILFNSAERRQRAQARWAEESRLAADPAFDHIVLPTHCHARCQPVAHQAQLADIVPNAEPMTANETLAVLTNTIHEFFAPGSGALVPYWAFDFLRIDYSAINLDILQAPEVLDVSESESSISVEDIQQITVDVIVHVSAADCTYYDTPDNELFDIFDDIELVSPIPFDEIEMPCVEVEDNAAIDEQVLYPDENEIYIDQSCRDIVSDNGDANNLDDEVISCNTSHSAEGSFLQRNHRRIRLLRSLLSDQPVSLREHIEAEPEETPYIIVEPETESNESTEQLSNDSVESAVDIIECQDEQLHAETSVVQMGVIEYPTDITDYMGNRLRRRYRFVFRLPQLATARPSCE